MKRILMLTAVWAGILSMACGSQNQDNPEPVETKGGQLRVMVDAEGAADVRGATLDIYHCNERDLVFTKTGPLEMWTRHSLIPSYVGAEDHLFLEHDLNAPSGCYDVEVTLLDEHEEPSAYCSVALGKSISIAPDETAEVLLYSLCSSESDQGTSMEGPVVEMVRFYPTAHLSCDENVKVCATVKNNGHDVELEWAHLSGKPLLASPEMHPMSVEGERNIQCATWSPYYQGETIGEVTARPASQAPGKDKDHSVVFSLYMECPDRKKVADPQPPERDHKTKKYPGDPKYPKDPKPPKDEGELEVIAALNHPPHLIDFEHHPNKFVGCPAQVTLCATAIDPDGDPMEFYWEKISGLSLKSGPVVVSETETDGAVTQCVEIVFQKVPTDYQFKVTVFDLFFQNGEEIRAEDWFLDNGYGVVKSRAELTVPVYVMCDKEEKKGGY